MIDGILTFINSSWHKDNDYNICKASIFDGMENGEIILKDCYVAKQNGIFAHGKTIKSAECDVEFKKLDEVGESQFEDLTLTDTVSKQNAIIIYRIIGRACQFGTDDFLENYFKNHKEKENYTIAEICEITKGQWGNEEVCEFFKYKNQS